MSIAELIRQIESKKRIEKRTLQERATYDYILADLIGRSIARIHSSVNKLPSLEDAYNGLFDSEELKEERQRQIDELSAIRFRQFAQHFNKKFEEV